MSISGRLDKTGKECHSIEYGEVSLYMRAELSYLDEGVPAIKVDLRYCWNDNFVEHPIDGYTTGRRDTAECLSRSQAELNAKGLGLLLCHLSPGCLPSI